MIAPVGAAARFDVFVGPAGMALFKPLAPALLAWPRLTNEKISAPPPLPSRRHFLRRVGLAHHSIPLNWRLARNEYLKAWSKESSGGAEGAGRRGNRECQFADVIRDLNAACTALRLRGVSKNPEREELLGSRVRQTTFPVEATPAI